MTELDKIELNFSYSHETKRATVFTEDLGEFAWSDQDVAVGYLYVKKQTLEMISNPKKLRVVIEPLEG